MRLLILLLALVASPALALNEGLQCVPYARAVSGVEIRGDAHTWWGQAKGRYSRGNTPKIGAVVAFKPHGGMRLGHVAAVQKIIDNRTILISHANWSTIGGRRGHIEENVRVVDASENNDWSRVQVWYTPNQALGGTRWPIHGFIYPKAKRSDNQVRMAVSNLTDGKAGYTPPPSGGREQVRVAAYTPKPIAKPRKLPAAPTFHLSNKTLSEVDRKAVGEKKSAWRKLAPTPAPQNKDVIGDLLGSLGS